MIRQPGPRQPRSSTGIHFFVALMIVVIAVQGTYLGYVVGILTTLERRFGFTSEKTGLLLSSYDLGHTIAILLAGYFGTKGHLPRITGAGVLLSGLSMLVLIFPAVIFQFSESEEQKALKLEAYVRDYRCDSGRYYDPSAENCKSEHTEHFWAFVILLIGQFLAGVFAAPFNTLAYVYIDNNVLDRRQSPFLLGLLTSMYAFGPALGFGLSALTTRVYTTLEEAPHHISKYSMDWIGAWWVGFVLCALFYIATSIPFFFFPKSYTATEDEKGIEMRQPLHHPHLAPSHCSDEPKMSGYQKFVFSTKEFILVIIDLCRNPVFVSIVFGWTFGSYLIAGYTTFLPKYIETQYGKSASAADFYAGIISVGSIAVSTAVGGWLLTRYDISPRKGLVLLMASWFFILFSYVAGTFVGCKQAQISGLHYEESRRSSSLIPFFDVYTKPCSVECACASVMHFDPVNFDGENFYSPCHAGCTSYSPYENRWTNCQCLDNRPVESGIAHPECNDFVWYMVIMFIGLFAGNLFFMVTMMIVLRQSVYDDQKVIALSFASFFTNLLGFIPAPIFLGWVVDRACILWHSRCHDDGGNCVLYDNEGLRVSFHLSSASLQALAILAIFVCYLFSRNRKFPEEEDGDYVYAPDNDGECM
ncbi:unnamed protein product, partial [Mesorhabditis spiculigera]